MSENQNDSSQNDALWNVYVCSRLREMAAENSWTPQRLVEVGQKFLESNKVMGRLEFLDELQQHCREITAKEDMEQMIQYQRDHESSHMP